MHWIFGPYSMLDTQIDRRKQKHMKGINYDLEKTMERATDSNFEKLTTCTMSVTVVTRSTSTQ